MRSFIFASAVLAAGLLAPVHAGAQEEVRTTYEDAGPNRLLLATGLATLGFAYSVSAWVGLTSPHESERWLVVPFVGPWAAIAQREQCGESPLVPCATDSAYIALLAVDGALQLAGIAQIALAIVKRERREVERPLVMPIAIRGGAGLSATAAF